MESRRHLPLVTGLFVTCLVVSNIIAVKVASFGSLPGLGELFLPVAVILFPVSYILGDILTEVYGYGQARRVIWIGFACNLLAVAAIHLGGLLAPAPFWKAGTYDDPAAAQAAWDAILGFTPRLLVASFVAYLAGEFLNAYVLARLKIATSGRLLWLRTIGSTLAGQLADSALFITIAFAGVLPDAALPRVVLTQWLFKSAFEAAATPLTYAVVYALKRAEGADPFDRGTNFNPFRLG